MVEKSPVASLGPFLRAVGGYWILYLGGAVVSAAGLFVDFKQIPRPIFIAALTLFAIAAMFHAFHQIRVECDTRREELDAIRAARPRLSCRGQKFVPLFNRGTYQFHALQLWLCNEPETRGDASLAKNVSVRVAFHRDDVPWQPVLLGSQWVDAFDPEAASFTDVHQQVDIPANDVPAKFFLVLHHVEVDDDCYAHSFGKLPGKPDGRYAPYKLPPGRYRVVVNLKGDNVDQELTFQFRNGGRGVEPEVLSVPKQHDPAVPSQAAGPETCPACGQPLPD